MNECRFLEELGGIFLSVIIAGLVVSVIVIILVWFAVFLEKVATCKSLLKASPHKFRIVLLLLPSVVPIVMAACNLFDSSTSSILFMMGAIVGVIICFYCLFLIQREHKSVSCFLLGMVGTAIVIHMLLMFLYFYEDAVPYIDFYQSILCYLPLWFGVTIVDEVNELVLLKVVSFIYMGLFIGVCSAWVSQGFNRKGNE